MGGLFGLVQGADDTALQGVCGGAPEAVERGDRTVEGPDVKVQQGDDRPLQEDFDAALEGSGPGSQDSVFVFCPSLTGLWR